MRVLVFAPYGLISPHFETDLELAQLHLDAGDEVTMIVCDGVLPSCDVNRDHLVTQCARCVGRRRQGTKLLSPRRNLQVIALSTLIASSMDLVLPRRFESVEALRDFEYEGFDAGYAVLSSVVSALRAMTLVTTRLLGIVCPMISSRPSRESSKPGTKLRWRRVRRSPPSSFSNEPRAS